MRQHYTLNDYHKILDCKPNTSQETIKAQFRKLAFKYHPDAAVNEKASEKRKEELAKQFALIKEAYDVLSQNATKQSLDQEMT